MQAKDLMTTDVVVVKPDTTTRDIARTLLDHSISAVPVVDSSGAPVGMVSAGDLIGRSEIERDARRDWWLAILAEGHGLNRDFLSSLGTIDETAKDIMVAPVITIVENTEAAEIARLLGAYRIKRLPVVRDGRIVGIVSRADLLKVLAAERPADTAPKPPGFISSLVSEIDDHFFSQRASVGGAFTGSYGRDGLGRQARRERFPRAGSRLQARKGKSPRQGKSRGGGQRIKRVKALVDTHIDDGSWHAMLHGAHEAAERGAKGIHAAAFPEPALQRRRSRHQRHRTGLGKDPARRGGGDLSALGTRSQAARLSSPGPGARFPGRVSRRYRPDAGLGRMTGENGGESAVRTSAGSAARAYNFQPKFLKESKGGKMPCLFNGRPNY